MNTKFKEQTTKKALESGQKKKSTKPKEKKKREKR